MATGKPQMTVKQKIIKVPVMKTRDDAILPEYAHEGDAGLDMYTPYDFILPPDENLLVDTGIAFGLPQGIELQPRAKSGQSLNKRVSLSNGIGTVDPPYRGSVGFILENRGQNTLRYKRGDKVGQIVPNEIPVLELELVDDISDTQRGTGGYGSTGDSVDDSEE